MSSFHCGVRRKTIPFDAPSNVIALMSNVNNITYGNNARKYDAFPELLIPREIIANIIIHKPSKHNVRRQLGKPMHSK